MRPLLRLGRSEPLATESSFRSLLMGFVQMGPGIASNDGCS